MSPKENNPICVVLKQQTQEGTRNFGEVVKNCFNIAVQVEQERDLGESSKKATTLYHQTADWSKTVYPSVKSILVMRLLQNEKTESLIAKILIVKSLLGSKFHALLFNMSKSKSDKRAMSIWQNPSATRISSKSF